jgi:hypothetical protein
VGGVRPGGDADKLDGMVQAFIELEAREETRNLAHAEWVALLLDREAAGRGTRRTQTSLRAARLRHSQATIGDVDYCAPRRFDKTLFRQLGTYRWIAERRGLLVIGPCGITEPTTTPATTTAVNGKPPKGAKDEPQTSPIVRPAG